MAQSSSLVGAGGGGGASPVLGGALDLDANHTRLSPRDWRAFSEPLFPHLKMGNDGPHPACLQGMLLGGSKDRLAETTTTEANWGEERPPGG